MPLARPHDPVEEINAVWAYLRQFDTDIKRIWGRIPQPSSLTPHSPPGAPTLATIPLTGGGGGTGARKLARLTGHVAGNATGITVDLCDDSWAASGSTETVSNAHPHYLLNVSGGTRVVIEQTEEDGAWRIMWCQHGPHYRATVNASIAKNGTGNATLLIPGTETSAGVTVTTRNRFLAIQAGAKNFWVVHDGVEYVFVSGEC